ncbi:type I 3-dehydroquinate dehydratase [Dietzia sp.]|uniref:type I 3-dehydroquinate dehydratase n=1 Tax=Dietzia sp. TaxID=1871616 RepID=UPI002FD8BA56
MSPSHYPAPLRPDRTAVIVPLVGGDVAALRAECALVADQPTGVVDLVEWRVDRFADAAARGSYAAGLAAIEEHLPGVPILATYRTPAEEGQPDLRPDPAAESPDVPAAYVRLVAALAAEPAIALVDVERSHSLAAEAMAACTAAGTPVVLSEHHFEGPLTATEASEAFENMAAAGASVAKLAIMPGSPADVTALMDATARAAAHSPVPLIAIAMGELGRITRVGAPAFGSAATYCTVAAASAPGQVPAAEARAAVDALSASLGTRA